MIRLDATYDREVFLTFLSESFLPGFRKDVRKINVSGKKVFDYANILGKCEELDLYVFEFNSTGSTNSRVKITKEAFSILKDHSVFRALAVFKDDNDTIWRLSLLSATPEFNDKSRLVTRFSNPKRWSFALGPKAKVKTPTKFLVGRGTVKNMEDLKERFSIEVVNKEFYKEISREFTKLVGGKYGKGKSKVEYHSLLRLPGIAEKSQQAKEYAVRLIGRLIFCWFLKEKLDSSGEPLLSGELLSSNSAQNNPEYFHNIIEPIFFEVLNKPIRSRKQEFSEGTYSQIPYLNGGLFTPREDDFYSYSGLKQSDNRGKVVVPNTWLIEFLQLLETYNFTIDENTGFDEELSIDPEMLGRIFENLLAEINPETLETARKRSGSYYTPRVIVDYMVDKCLLLYLQRKTAIAEGKLKALLSYNVEDDIEYPLDDQEKSLVLNAIEKVKIIDPACGSGAYPMGALQKIVFVLEQIDPDGHVWLHSQIKNLPIELQRSLEKENVGYMRKLSIIRENIFGIDIQPIATEISRLRCFLTLIVDQDVDDFKENRGIDPLPNLEFKFVTANSLVSLRKSEVVEQIDMFEDSGNISKLKDARNEYFGVKDIVERETLKGQFKDIQREMAINLHKSKVPNIARMTEALMSWEPFKHGLTSWFDPDWMFGITKGFDIIIGNPPYLGEKGHKGQFKAIKDAVLGEFYQGKMDLFYFFFHLGLNLTANSGVIAYITTNYWVTATGGTKLRTDIEKRSDIVEIVNFNELKIFESAQGQHNMITVLVKGKENGDLAYKETKEIGYQGIEKISEILSSAPRYISSSNLFDNGYISITQKDDDVVLDKIKKNAIPLGIICNINTGIQTGADRLSAKHIEKFNIKGNEGEGIFVLNKRELEEKRISESDRLLRPWYKNSDIYRYGCKVGQGEFVIYATQESEIQPTQEIIDHLSRFRNILVDRREFKNNRKPFYLLHWPRDEKIFTGAKIIAPQRSSRNTFGYNEIPWYASADVYFITTKNESYQLKYILALLNSKLYYVWLYSKGKRKGNSLELYQTPLSEVPIRKVDISIQQKFELRVDELLKITSMSGYKDNQELIKKAETLMMVIDNMVFDLYELTEEERELVVAFGK